MKSQFNILKTITIQQPQSRTYYAVVVDVCNPKTQSELLYDFWKSEQTIKTSNTHQTIFTKLYNYLCSYFFRWYLNGCYINGQKLFTYCGYNWNTLIFLIIL